MKKRVALAQALVASRMYSCWTSPPTIWIWIPYVGWKSLLTSYRGSVMLITHDRAFFDAVATRIVELDRGQIRSYPGNFAAYEATKERELMDESLANARFDKLLAQEEVWIRKGVEARRTRSVGRVKRLDQLRTQRVKGVTAWGVCVGC